MRIALAGTGRLGASLMRPLLESGHRIVCVLQDGRRVKAAWQRAMYCASASVFARESSPVALARSNRIPVIWLTHMTDEALASVRALDPDLLLVGSFGIILKRPLLDLPRIGCVNCHSSLLPRHRGPNPFAGAILSGDAETGVTFHVVDEGIDTGDILDQVAFPIGPRDNAMKLYRHSCELAGERVVTLLDRLERDGLQGAPQDHAAATYEPKMKRDDLRIRWDAPAERIDRLVRACSPTPLARFLFRGRRVFVNRARFDPAPTGAEPGVVVAALPALRVATGDGILEIQAAHVLHPFPWPWPAPWSRPNVGDQLE